MPPADAKSPGVFFAHGAAHTVKHSAYTHTAPHRAYGYLYKLYKLFLQNRQKK